MDFKLINNTVFAVIFLTVLVSPPLTRSLLVKSEENEFNTEKAKILVKLAKSADIKAFMNTEVNPCSDFYAFACGKWKRVNPAQLGGNINTDKFQPLTKGIELKLNKLLSQNKTGNGDIEDKIKDFYASCLNTKTNNIKYRLALQNVYKEFGQFSVLKTEEEKEQTNFEWWSTVAKIQYKYGKSIILSVFILDDFKNKSKTMAYVGPPEFDMTQGAVNMVHVIQEERIRKYLKSYFNIATDDALRMAKDFLDFEKYLTQGATDVRLGKSVEKLLTLYNVTDLSENYKNLFNATAFLQIVLGTKNLPEQVYVYDESYLEELHDVFNSTDEQLVEDYILWLFLEEYIIDITSSNLEQECTEKTKKFFGKFIDHAIYNQYRTKEAENDIYELWDDIKSTFRDSLETDKYYWISNATRKHAIEKLNNMNLTINSYDNDNFIELFKNLDIDPTNYVLNVQNIREHAESLRVNKFEKPMEEDTQILSFTPVYNILENRIKIPVALLQPHVIWDPVYPKAIQYGTLGYLIAHEMIHGFDDEGRNYDANGNANTWWDEKSAYEFESRRKCFQEQYHKYIYDGKPLPDSALQSENIADNGGINIAYAAYLRWLQKQKQSHPDVEANERLPRLEFNNRELFYISFAQVWCEDIHSIFRSTFADGDIHAPGMYRVIGSLSNCREFSWIFKCNEITSRMDPPKKCEIY